MKSAGNRTEIALLAGLVVLVVFCFWPLTGYFFAQDDLWLMRVSANDLGEQLSRTFGPAPHHFRPLTKFIYFAAAYRAFGLNPMPHHLVSLLLHVANTLLVFVLLRRLRVPFSPALVVAGLFGMNAAFFHAVGWISCIQQLMGTFFMLLSIVLALAAIERGHAGRLYLATFAYLLALMSVEQTFLAPVIVSAVLVMGLAGGRHTLRRSFTALWPHYLLLSAYLVMRLLKGVPGDGRTRFHYGTNILENVSAYAGAMVDFWPDVGTVITLNPLAVTVPQGIFAALIVYHLARRRWREVIFGIGFSVVTLLPALFLVRHYFYYHTYVAAFGALYLGALALRDLWKGLERLRLGGRTRHLIAPVVCLVIIAALSSTKVRHNARRAEIGRDTKPTSFMIRRALVAERFYTTIKEKQGDLTGVSRVFVLWGSPGMGAVPTKSREMAWVLSEGRAVELFLDHDVEVSMEPGTAPPPQPTATSRVFFYDDRGTCYTYEEVMGQRRPVQK